MTIATSPCHHPGYGTNILLRGGLPGLQTKFLLKGTVYPDHQGDTDGMFGATNKRSFDICSAGKSASFKRFDAACG